MDYERKTFVNQRHINQAHNYLCGKFGWYDNWHNYKYHKKVHLGIIALAMIVALILVTQYGLPKPVRASGSYSWDLGNGYSYGHDGADSSKIEATGDKIQLKSVSGSVTHSSDATFNGTNNHTEVVPSSNKVTLQSGQASGDYTSPIINAGTSAKMASLNISRTTPVEYVKFSDRNINGSLPNAKCATVADYNGDGKNDVMYASDSPYLVLNNGDGTFGTPLGLGGTNVQLMSCLSEDFDSDGKIDFLLGAGGYGDNAYSSVVFYKNLGGNPPSFESSIIFEQWQSGFIGGQELFYAGDLNNDGHKDMILKIWNTTVGGSQFKVFLNNGDTPPTFTTSATLNVYSTGTNVPTPASVGDLNGDGLPDIAAVLDYHTVGWYKNNGNGTFSANTLSSNFYNASSIVVVDLDNDGHPDMVAVDTDNPNSNVQQLHQYMNNNNGVTPTFSESLNHTGIDGSTATLSVADIDSDGKNDLVEKSNWGNGMLNWLRNMGGSPPMLSPNLIDLSQAGATDKTILKDLNGDGRIDIVDAGQFNGSYYINYWLNQQDPTQNEVKFQIKACQGQESNCSSHAFVGSDGTANTYFTAESNSLLSLNLTGGYFQYKAFLTKPAAGETTPSLNSAQLTWISYPTDKPYIESPNFNASALGWKSFSATVSTDTDVKFQFSNDNGATYKWWDSESASWATATKGDWTYANTASTITGDNFKIFPASGGIFQLKWLAILASDGFTQTNISDVSADYKTDATPPNNPDQISAHGFITDSLYNSVDQPVVTYVKTADDPVDEITDSVHLTRGTSMPLYNTLHDSAFSWDSCYSSPIDGTEWNGDGWSNLSNLTSRSYMCLDWASATIGRTILGKELILHVVAEDRYYKIKFTSWDKGRDSYNNRDTDSQKNFSYTRQEILKKDISADKGVAHYYPVTSGVISWNEPTDLPSNETQSGIKGYYLNRSTSATPPTGEPIEKGDLTEIFDGIHSGVHYQEVGNEKLGEMPAVSGTYYYWIQTVDNDGNYSTPSLIYTLNVDPSVYNAPTQVFSQPSGWSKTKDFTFDWTAPTAGDSVSPLLGYQYRIGWETGDGNITTKPWLPADSVFDKEATSYQLNPAVDYSSIEDYTDQQWQDPNITKHTIYQFQLRAVNSAGRFSSTAQTIFYYSTRTLDKPHSLENGVTHYGTENDWSFRWDPPSTIEGASPMPIVKYYYAVSPTADDITPDTTSASIDATPSPSVSRSAYAKSQGVNKFCVIAQDSDGNLSPPLCYSFENHTAPPSQPRDIKAIDVSDRDHQEYSIVLKWREPAEKGTGFAGYEVFRALGKTGVKDPAAITSADCGEYSVINSSIQGTSFVDDNFDQDSPTKQYCYYIKSIDNAQQTSIEGSNVATIVPIGIYVRPPILKGDIITTPKAFSATVAWSTEDREDPENSPHKAKGSVIFGKDKDKLSGYADNTIPLEKNYESDHVLSINGLEASTHYYYQVRWTDENGNVGTSDVLEFNTKERPTASEVTTPENYITLNSVTVTYKTNVKATTEIVYGTSENPSGEPVGNKSGYVTDHSLNLTGLAHSTKYYFKIVGTDADGQPVDIGTNYSFQTLTMPKIESKVTMDQDKEAPTTTYNFAWTTNIKTSTVVYYQNNHGERQSKSSPDLTTDHAMTVGNLSDQSIYAFEITGTEEHGIVINNPYKTDITTPLDTRPPKITNLTVEVKSSGFGLGQKAQIVISWETDEPATSQVEYEQGIAGTSYRDKSKTDAAYSTSHAVILSELEPSKIYHLRAVSADLAGNLGYSEDTTTITGKMQQSVLDVITSSLEKSLGWIFGIFSS